MIPGLRPKHQQLLSSINDTQAELSRAQRQISSGLRVSRASDDPHVIGDLLQTRSDLARISQVTGNLTGVKNEVETADVSLQNAVQFMEQAGVLAVQGANTTMTAGSRATLAQQVDGLLQQMVAISRTQVNGIYIFGGDRPRHHPTRSIPRA